MAAAPSMRTAAGTAGDALALQERRAPGRAASCSSSAAGPDGSARRRRQLYELVACSPAQRLSVSVLFNGTPRRTWTQVVVPAGMCADSLIKPSMIAAMKVIGCVGKQFVFQHELRCKPPGRETGLLTVRMLCR